MGGERVRRRSTSAATDTHGILDQTIIAAFANPAQAKHALASLRSQCRVKPRELMVVKSERDPLLNRIGEFADDVRSALADGKGIVMVRLDETDVFEALELLDEDMASVWTVAMPPVPARSGR